LTVPYFTISLLITCILLEELDFKISHFCTVWPPWPWTWPWI